MLSLGPDGLTLGTILDSPEATVQTVTDNLFTQCQSENHRFAIFFEPTASTDVVNGELSFGMMDETKFLPPLILAPISECLQRCT